jgi:hypothetical protein
MQTDNTSIDDMYPPVIEIVLFLVPVEFGQQPRNLADRSKAAPRELEIKNG